jgi:hypothetical protein
METEEGISKQVLQDKLDEIKSSILRSHWWAYHVEGVQNFIYHLDCFHSDKIKNKIAKDIFEYLCQAEEKINQNQTPRRSAMELISVFNPICQIYEDELGFILKPDWLFWVLGMILLFFVLNYFFATILSALAAVSLAKAIYSQIKMKARKVY